MFSDAERLEPSDLQSLQLTRLQRTLERMAGQVPFYRQLFAAQGVAPEDCEQLQDLHNFPFTTREQLRQHYPFGLFAEPLENVRRIHASSGTTGKRKIVGYTEHDIEVWAECVARCLVCSGAQPGHILQNSYGYGLFTGGLGLHYGAERLGMTVVPMGGGSTEGQIELLQDLGADGICCTPSYLLNIIETMEAMDLPPDSLNLKYGVLGAEPWTEAMRDEIEARLGIDAVDIYGLSEVIGPGVANECVTEKHGAHVFEDHFYPEIVDPDSGEPLPAGEPGELVFTSLTKEAFPVLRYRTGDICTLIEDECSCGRVMRRMSRIVGRVDDMVTIRGVNVYPSQVEKAILSCQGVAPFYRLVVDRQEQLDELTIEAEVTAEVYGQSQEQSGEALERLRETVERKLYTVLGLRAQASLLAPDTLDRSGGKAQRVVDRRELVS